MCIFSATLEQSNPPNTLVLTSGSYCWTIVICLLRKKCYMNFNKQKHTVVSPSWSSCYVHWYRISLWTQTLIDTYWTKKFISCQTTIKSRPSPLIGRMPSLAQLAKFSAQLILHIIYKLQSKKKVGKNSRKMEYENELSDDVVGKCNSS